MNKRVRRESGRTYNKRYDPEQGCYYEIYWNDWNDYRDGQRDCYTDMTKKQPRYIAKEHWGAKPFNVNDKIKKLLRRREIKKAMKHKKNIYKG